MDDQKTDGLELRILVKACEGPQPFHAIREAVEDAKGRAALALCDNRPGAAGDALRDLRAALGAREAIVLLGGPEAIVAAGRARDKAESKASQKEAAAKREAQQEAREKRAARDSTAAIAREKNKTGGTRPKPGGTSGGQKRPTRSSASKKAAASRPKGMIKPKSS